MSTTNLNVMDAALKIYFSGSVVNGTVAESELLDLLTQNTSIKTDETTGGRFIEQSVMFQLPGSVGARRETDYIPVPQDPKFLNTKVNLKKILASLEMTGDVMRRVKGNPGAYINWLEQAMPLLEERLANYNDRVLFGYSAGALAQISAVGTDAIGAYITLKNSHGIAGLGNAWINFLEGDTLIAAAEINAATIRGGGPPYSVRTVGTIDPNTNRIYIDSAVPVSWVADDYLFLGDAAASASAEGTTFKEPMGLQGIVDDGTIVANFQNIPRTGAGAQMRWRSTVFDSQTGGFTGGLTEELLDYVDEIAFLNNNAKASAWLVSKLGNRQFWKDMKRDRVLNDPRSFTGGKGALSMLLGARTVELRAPRKMPPQLAFGLSPEYITHHHLGSVEWDDTTGSIWKQVVDSGGRKDAFYAFCREYKEFSCSQPAKQIKITNLNPAWAPA